MIVAETRERVVEKLNAYPERSRERFRAMGIIGTREEVTQAYQDLVDLGLTYFMAGVNDLETVELLGTRVIPNVMSRGGAQKASVA